MIHTGPVPYMAHQAADYLLAALLIVAPFLFGFSDVDAATAVSIVAGVIVLVMVASTDGPLSLVNSVPIPVHVLGDLGLGVLLIASPFLFGFSDESDATAFFIVVGVVELLLVIATTFPRQKRETATRAERRREREARRQAGGR